VNASSFLLSLRKVSKSYQTHTLRTWAVREVSLDLSAGEFVVITGPSGCGKSTLLTIMGLLDEQSSGEVLVRGTAAGGLAAKTRAKLRNRHFGFVFQDAVLVPDLSVVRNVMLPLAIRGESTKSAERKAIDVLERVDLADRRDHYPWQLSGGQAQRAAIARALVGEPDVILADEPTGNLDSALSQTIVSLFLDLNKAGRTIVMVTHDGGIAEQGTRAIRLLDGRILDDSQRTVTVSP
jgi:putative ABC transport system ATP-binding protein